MGPVTRLIGGGIGLVQEARAKGKSPEPSTDIKPSATETEHDSDSADDLLDTDEAQWELDEAQQSQELEQHSEPDNNDVDIIMKNFFHRYPPPSYAKATGDLPLPIIIPQKRPGSKLHGFIHAYAPVLEDCDIDQRMWFDFLDGFGKSIKYSPGFHVANAAVAFAALGVTIAAGPMIITHLVALTVHTSIEATRRGYIRFQSNKYLDTMNEKLFKPRGLYCMVFAYKPNSKKPIETIDQDTTINAAIAKRGDGKGSKLGGVSGVSHDNFDLPESAPLIFPELDALPEQEKQGKMKQTGNFLSDYYTRRARAKFEYENPDSRLNVMPKEEFASRYSDPNHPASNGHIINLITGGKINRPTMKQRRARRREMVSSRRSGRRGGRSGLLGSVKRKMHEDVVYMMVVNMPSEEEMAQAEAEVKAMKSS